MAKGNHREVTWAQAFRDIIVASMNRGQLPILAVALIIGLAIWRMPAQDVSKWVFEVTHLLATRKLLGYALFLVAMIGWYLHARWMRKEFSEECLRIGTEKSDLQSKLAGTKFKSSDHR